MKNLIINIGKKSKKVLKYQISTKKKNKILKEYCQLIDKNKKNIIKLNQKDLINSKKKVSKQIRLKDLF